MIFNHMHPPCKKLVLFDIDGTLLSADRSGYEALLESVVEVLGARRGLEGIKLDGNTDLNVLRQISLRDGTPFPSPELLAQLKAHYAEILEAKIQTRGHLKPGVATLLERLSANANVCLGLVTGNIREAANIKLARFGIERYFKIGAYGCEHYDRSELIRMAVRRAFSVTGQQIGFNQPEATINKNIIMVGDTINDISAALRAGVRILAVATGSVSLADLAEKIPDQTFGWAISDLSDTAMVESLLLNS